MDTLKPFTGPRLIELGFPCHEVGAETQREQDVGKQPPTHRLHVWWARRPLTASRAAVLASLSPPDFSPDDFLRQLGIEQRAAEIGDDTWILADDLLGRVRRNDDGAEVLPVDALVLRRFQREQERRSASRALIAELEAKDPTLGVDPILTRWREECRPLVSRWVYEGARLLVVRRVGDPDFAAARIDFEDQHSIRTPENKYGYERAFGNAPAMPPSRLTVLDPTAGGGSIPLEAMRLGHHVIANELNPVAAAILYATLDYPARFGGSLSNDLRLFGDRLVGEMRRGMVSLFPIHTISAEERAVLTKNLLADPELVERYLEETLDGFLFCRQVTCPSCLGQAPLLNSCWLAKNDVEPWAVRIVTDGRTRGGKARFETFRVVDGRGPNGEDPDFATVADGVGTCVHCRQAIQRMRSKRKRTGGPSMGAGPTSFIASRRCGSNRNSTRMAALSATEAARAEARSRERRCASSAGRTTMILPGSPRPKSASPRNG
jgi:adenine-specific DNA methylase